MVLQYLHLRALQSSPSRRIFASLAAMILLVTSLCLSTFVRGAPSTFFASVLLTAASMAIAASYLCTAVYGGAAFLGAAFLRAVLSGQASIALAVSVVQVASSVIALWGSSPKSVSVEALITGERDDQAEEIAARIFFGVSAVFLSITLVAFAWLTRQSFYKSVISALEPHRGEGIPDEFTGLVTDERRSPSTETNLHVCQVFSKNLIFMFSIAYVFTVTLVSV